MAVASEQLPFFNVTLLVFSGRPNPSWELSGESARELLERIEESLSASIPADHVGGAGLGYQGFLVRLRGGDETLPSELIIVRRTIRWGPDDEPHLVRDEGDAESWLLEDARRRGFEPSPGSSA